MQFLKRLDSPLVNITLIAFVYGIYLIFLLVRFNFNPAYLISLGEKFADLNQIPKNIVVWKNYGYDGQFYYRLALNPFTYKRDEFGITLDISSYRHQRIIYPLLTWVLSLGQKDLVPKILLIVNFTALLLMAFVGALFAKSLSLHSLWGLVFVIHPGFPYTLSRDLTEILQALFLLSSLLLIKKGRFLISSILLTLAILTKETALSFAIILLLTFRSRYFLIPPALYTIWQILLFVIWGQTPIFLANLSLGPLFLGVGSYLKNTLAFITYDQKVGFLQICFLLTFAISVFNSFSSAKIMTSAKIAWILYLLLATLYTSYIWVSDIAFFRALSEFYILGAAILISSRSKVKYFIFLLTFVIWLLSIKQFGYF